MSERPKEIRCWSRTWRQKSPKEPRHVFQDESTIWICALCEAVLASSALSSCIDVSSPGSPGPLSGRAAEPLLERAQRHPDRVGEVLEVDVGMLLAQVEDEAAEGVVVAPSLGPSVDAARVVHDEGHRRRRAARAPMSGSTARGGAGGRPTGRSNEGNPASRASRNS